MPIDVVNQASSDNSDTVENGDPSQDSAWGSALSGLAAVVAAAAPIIQSATSPQNQLKYDAASKQWVYGTPVGYYGQPQQAVASQNQTMQNFLIIGFIVLAGVLAVKHL